MENLAKGLSEASGGGRDGPVALLLARRMDSMSLARGVAASHMYLTHLCPAASILNQATRCRDQAAPRAGIRLPAANILNPALLVMHIVPPS
jgi:hypothetical protein